MKTVQDVVSFAQGNFEALSTSTRILATGVQDLSQQAIAAGQGQFAESMSHLQALSGVTSLSRLFELQGKAIRSTLEATIAESNRLTGMALNLVQAASAPIAARAGMAMQSLSPAI